ncbi:hypothetical protein SBRCBS47491_001727 [Sporothrix bragantina]|uniref:2EXR domain-containing protein n=1 Tax=Sporothrix bragantina TaxID=671064 RepID=A0ABP0B133_9PEZI
MDTRGRASKRRRLADGTPSGALGDVVDALTQTPCPALRPTKEPAGPVQKAPTYDTFHRFPDLPAELRLYIWREVAQEASKPFHPLRVRVYRGIKRIPRPNSKRGYANQNILRLASMPDLGPATRRRRALLQVSREARTEMLKLWDAELELERRGILRFSYKFDLVYLDIVNAAVMEDLIDRRLDDDLPDFAQAIGHVGFDMIPSVPLWLLNRDDDLEPKLSLMLCFPKLHSLSLVSFSAFQSEIDWTSHEDVTWVMSRTRAHRVYLRSFPTIANVDYTAQSSVGKRTSGPRDKHDCAICTIHKCVYINQVIGKRACSAMLTKKRVDTVLGTGRRSLTGEEMAWLRRLKHHTLIASSPDMAPLLPAYKSNTAGWWINRPTARRQSLSPRAGSGASAAGEGSSINSNGHNSDHGHVGGTESAADVQDSDEDSEDDFDDDDHHHHHHHHHGGIFGVGDMDDSDDDGSQGGHGDHGDHGDHSGDDDDGIDNDDDDFGSD